MISKRSTFRISFSEQALGSNDTELILSDSDMKKLQNRRKWKHGFSQCGRCQRKLMYELSKGKTLDEIISILHERHPQIEHIRRYAMNAIRQTTGYGLFDDYIVSHDLWKVREPVFAPSHVLEKLKTWWKEGAIEGAKLVERDNQIKPILDNENDPMHDALEYVYFSGKMDRRR